MTSRQIQLVAHIRAYRYREGISPTFQELADLMGVSKVTVFDHIAALQRQGVVRRTKYARTLEIVNDDPISAEACNPRLRLPVLGSIGDGGLKPLNTSEKIGIFIHNHYDEASAHMYPVADVE